MNTAYSYARVSSKRQISDNSTGISRQQKRAVEICKANGWTLSEKTFTDMGVSAFKGDNRLKGDLATFIQLAKENKLGENPILIIEDFSRFSRQDIDESETAILNLLKCGVDIHVAFNNRTFTKESTKETISRIEILVSLKSAYEFSRNLSIRVKAAQKIANEKIKSGKIIRTSRIPRYYSFNDNTNCYEQNAASEIVKKIIEHYLAGNSLYKVSQILNDSKIKTIGYTPKLKWSRMVIKAILSSKTLYGEFMGTKDFFGNPILDKSTFDKIQITLDRNSGSRGRFGSDFVNIFKGTGKCICCGGSMSMGVEKFSSKSGKAKKHPYRYLRCSSVSNSMPCTNRQNFNLLDIEAEFFMEALNQQPEALFSDKDTSKIEREITSKETKLKSITNEVNKMIALSATLDMEELKLKLKSLEKERDLLKKEIDALNLQRGDVQGAVKQFANLKNIISNFDTDNLTYSKETNKIIDALQVPAVRMEVRNTLPSIISKVVFNCKDKQFEVFNKAGKSIYSSFGKV